MNIEYALDPGAFPPRHAHPNDAGIDLAAASNMVVPVASHRRINTGVRVAIPAGHVGLVFVRSSVGIKRHLVLSNGTGVIDAGYTGPIILSLCNLGDSAEVIQEGDYIAQLVIVPIVTPHLVQVDALEATQRGEAGIGSTDQPAA